ncbi:MAG: hypothetical protein NTX79_04665 [Candidatus Micrarchaeota archaeon]|nr:hypothetical protein [Candidatus Micrarchaeota archaeon]
MTHRCDRCRAPYESGADLGGHDYCMTCYTQLKQEEARKRIEEERLRQKQIDAKKHYLHQDYMAQSSARLLRARGERAEDERRQDMFQSQSAKRRDEQEKLRKKKRWDDNKPKNRVVGEELQIFTPLGRKKKPAHAPPQMKKGEQAAYAAHLLQSVKNAMKRKTKPPAKPILHAGLSLSVAAGLPVSLSVGQKQVQALLIGKNASAAPIAAVLEVSILDSQKSAIASKAEPRTCTIEPDGESKIKVAFDLPEDAARGMLSFTALLKENAVYIDRQAAQSNAVSLSSQVKTSMDLQYKQGSALFESGALILSFNNVGESGGILEKSSFVTYFQKESAGKKAALAGRTKIKGGEKGILLAFAPSDGAAISRLELSLVGTDSNGKPYRLKRNIVEKKADAPEEKNEKG